MYMYMVCIPEGGSDLTAGVQTSLILAGERVIFEVIQPQSRVIGGHQDLCVRSHDSHMTVTRHQPCLLRGGVQSR